MALPLLLFGGAALLGGGSLFVKTVSDEAEETVHKTMPNLLLIGAAGLGLYAAYKAISKPKGRGGG